MYSRLGDAGCAPLSYSASTLPPEKTQTVVVEPATFLTRSSAQVSVQRKDANLGHQAVSCPDSDLLPKTGLNLRFPKQDSDNLFGI